MMMFEMFISAIPSFVLSLQPNTNRVKGKFIPYVLSRAIPGALTMAAGILSVYIVSNSSVGEAFGLVKSLDVTNPNHEYKAMMILALTGCGLVMLYRICQKFNVLRAILYIVTVSLCILMISVGWLSKFVYASWSAVALTMPQILLLIIIIQAAFPISAFLIKACDMFNPAED
jgi:cation-transporting ATPase E